ncbi:MAG: TIGR00730 family Rossman fold protein [Bacteroidota bacterium]
MRSVSVFCGSSPGYDSIYVEQARLLGKTLAERGDRIVFGGGKVGLMGAVADSALEAGGEVIGVIPEFMMPREVAHQGLTELIVTDSMTSRKLKMHELSDTVITLPGGFGTLEEFFEVVTWSQLSLIERKTGILNTNGYYNHLIAMLDNMVGAGFLKAENRRALQLAGEVKELIRLLD